MQFLRTVGAHVAIAIFAALVLSLLERYASAGSGRALPGALNSTAPISLLDNRPAPAPFLAPLFSRLSWLHLRVPGPTGTSVWGASLELPFSLRAPLPHTGTRLPVPLRPTPELEIGFRSIGKATGAVAQYVTPGGMRFGAGFYFNKIAVGAPPAHQAMLTFQIPLP
jgi:hypothetical protein